LKKVLTELVKKLVDFSISGFYDGADANGAGRYIVRFMPSFEGIYQFEIRGNFAENAFFDRSDDIRRLFF
jgi:hypothetical protein